MLEEYYKNGVHFPSRFRDNILCSWHWFFYRYIIEKIIIYQNAIFKKLLPLYTTSIQQKINFFKSKIILKLILYIYNLKINFLKSK